MMLLFSLEARFIPLPHVAGLHGLRGLMNTTKSR